ncbi:MAG: hypothetical protein VW405_09985 [Rhodospirillaceae bacterium]
MIPKMLLVQIDGGPGLGYYRFCGTRVSRYDERDYTNRRLDEIGAGEYGGVGVKLVEQYRAVVETRRPTLYVFHHADKQWGFQCECMLRLPLSADGDTVDKVLSIVEQPDRGTPAERALKDALADSGPVG